MAKVGEVWGDGTPIMVSVTEEPKPRVTVWMGLESTDLTAEQTEQLATYLKVAALGQRGERLVVEFVQLASNPGVHVVLAGAAWPLADLRQCAVR